MMRCRLALVVPFLVFAVTAGIYPLMSRAADEKQSKPGPTDKDAPKEFTKTESGLKYRILRKSDKAKPKATSTVKVHYKGWLDNGKEFDSSYKTGDPIEFPLNRVIKGWTEGVQLIGEGGMIELEIPYELGYGEAGDPPTIPAKATLHFIVELLESPKPLDPGPVDADAPEKFTETKTGLKYRIRRKGEAGTPKAASPVTAHFKGWFDNGDVFFSTYERRQPAQIQVNRLIKGWAEGIQLIGKGGMIELDIPHQLAFGAAGNPPAVPEKAQVHLLIEVIDFPTPTELGMVDKDAPEEFTTTDSGLKYRIRRKSKGEKPEATSTVKCHYQGWLDNGDIFDSSYHRGEPAEFPLNRVIKGWTEGLQLIGENGMIELEIPFQLGYGVAGKPPTIPPKSTLHFVIELLEVQ